MSFRWYQTGGFSWYPHRTSLHENDSWWSTQENFPYTLYGQRRLRSAYALPQSVPGIHCPLTDLMDTVENTDEQRRLRSDCALAQSDLDLRCSQFDIWAVFSWCVSDVIICCQTDINYRFMVDKHTATTKTIRCPKKRKSYRKKKRNKKVTWSLVKDVSNQRLMVFVYVIILSLFIPYVSSFDCL